MAWLLHKSDRVVQALSGTTFQFTANVPREVPDRHVEACLLAGCLPAGEPEQPKPVVENNAELDEVLQLLIDQGNPSDFKNDGTPKFQVVNSLLKTKKSATEIADRFAEIMSGGIN